MLNVCFSRNRSDSRLVKLYFWSGKLWNSQSLHRPIDLGLGLEPCSLKYHRTGFWGEATWAAELQVALFPSLRMTCSCMCWMAPGSHRAVVWHSGTPRKVCCVMESMLSPSSLQYPNAWLTEEASCLMFMEENRKVTVAVLHVGKWGHAQEAWNKV